MSQHTLPDGKTPDPNITDRSFHGHFPELGPPRKLIGRYYREGVPWDEFAMLYLEHLDTNQSAQERIKEIIEYARRSRVTLLCCEVTPDHCHRRLLAEYISAIAPDLSVVIK
jgi:uncharacterized protein YeaO (DUF488 family)